MRTIKKNSHVKTLTKKPRISRRISSALSLKNIKAHPYISLGTAAVALSAISGLVSWVRGKKAQERSFLIFRKR